MLPRGAELLTGPEVNDQAPTEDHEQSQPGGHGDLVPEEEEPTDEDAHNGEYADIGTEQPREVDVEQIDHDAVGPEYREPSVTTATPRPRSPARMIASPATSRMAAAAKTTNGTSVESMGFRSTCPKRLSLAGSYT